MQDIAPIREKIRHRRAITAKQRRAAKLVSEAIREGTEITQGELVIAAGYGPTVADKPHLVTRSQGYLAALAELGLTKELVVNALQEDIKAKPQRRAFELSIAGKWLGLEQKGDVTNQGVSIQNAVIIIQAPTNGLVEPPLDNK